MSFLGRLRVRLIAGHLGLVFVVFAAFSATAAEPKRVLILHSFGRDFAPWSEYARHMRAELIRQSPQPVDLFEASLATARFGDDQQEGPFVEYLRALFAKRPLDLVVTIGAPAAGFFQRYRQQLFPATPLLLTAIEQRRVAVTSLTANDIAVATDIDFAAVFDNILRVLPDTDHIAIVLGNSPLEKFWGEQIRSAAEPYGNRVAFTLFNDLSFDEMLTRVATLPPRSAIFFALLSVDAAGVPHNDGKALPRLRAVTNAPIFSYDDSYFGIGNVGGPVLSVPEVSRQAANVAVRILGGEAPSSIQTPPIGFGTARFDWRELQRWGIKEANLPAGSIVEFREPTFWSQHRWTVIGTLAIVLTQAAMIAALLFERGRRRVAETTSRRRFIEMTQMNRSLIVSTMSSSIAHELNQPLGAILNNAEAAEVLLTMNPLDIGQLREILADIRKDDKRAGDIISHLRGFLKKSEVQLHDVDMNQVIEDVLHIVEPEAAKRGIAIDASHATNALAVRADHVHLQQVVLNLALNGMDAMKDSSNGRRMVFQTARVVDAEVEVSVLDTGAGIPEHKLGDIFESFVTTKRHGMGLGLSIARTIVEMYGGRIWAENRQGGGAVVRFVLPLAGATA